jgi:hypothetical protein
MKLAPDAMSLARQLNQCSNQNHNLNQAQVRLSRLQRQDKDNLTLYQLLSQQNQSLAERVASVQMSWHRSSPLSPPSMTWLRTELESLMQLVTTHCQLVAWLYQGDTNFDGGPVNNLPLPKSPQPQPQRPASNASRAPASPDLN